MYLCIYVSAHAFTINHHCRLQELWRHAVGRCLLTHTRAQAQCIYTCMRKHIYIIYTAQLHRPPTHKLDAARGVDAAVEAVDEHAGVSVGDTPRKKLLSTRSCVLYNKCTYICVNQYNTSHMNKTYTNICIYVYAYIHNIHNIPCGLMCA